MKLIQVSIFFVFYSLTSLQAEAQSVDVKKASFYLNRLSGMVVGRPLNNSELTQIESKGLAAIEPIVDAWVKDPAFANSGQRFAEDLLRVSGNNGTVDFDVPGYMMRYLVKNNLPYSDLLTANYCVNTNDQTVACDSGAPAGAGVLTSRAFLAKYAGPYNIARASKVMKFFTCTSYPMDQNLEPSLSITDLIDVFSTTEGGFSFGNGTNCFSCHGQFGLHAQIFVKFNNNGQYVASANGLQSSAATALPGQSTQGTYTSHMIDPVKAASENSRMLGRTVANIREAAFSLVEHPNFYNCAVEKATRYFLRLDETQISQVNKLLFKEIATRAKALSSQPTLAQMVKQILIHPTVINSVVTTGGTL